MASLVFTFFATRCGLYRLPACLRSLATADMLIHSSVPQTPTTKGLEPDRFDAIIRELKRSFNLGIVVVDLSLSPLQRREQIKRAGPAAQRVNTIYSHLRKQFFKDQLVLGEILGRFRSDARDLCPGDAVTAEEVEQLQGLLLRLLLEPLPEIRSFHEALATSTAPSSSRSSPKRSSSDNNSVQSLKKHRGGQAIDDLPLPRPVWINDLSVRSAATTPASSQA